MHSISPSAKPQQTRDRVQLEMELELGLALPGSDRTPELGVHGEKRASLCRKRGVDEMLGKATLPLFIQKDNDEDGDDDSRQSKHLQELNLYVPCTYVDVLVSSIRIVPSNGVEMRVQQ